MKNKNKEILLFFILFCILILKYGYFGFKYYPILDDWIQYGGYTQYDNIFEDVIIRIGTYATRPAASFSDPYIWGSFWPNMGYPFFIITVLHFFSFLFIYKILKHYNLKIGVIFFAIFCILPLGTEATYWMSASTRLVVGIFFMTLSLYTIIKYLEKAKKIFIVLFSASNLISLCYYEQITVLSFLGAMIILFLSRKEIKHKVILLIPVMNAVLLGIYYKLCSTIGNLAQRGNIVKSNYHEHIMAVLDKITDVWGRVNIPLMKNGFLRGINLIVNDRSYIYLTIIILAIIIVCMISNEKSVNKEPLQVKIYAILIGGILFWIPYVPNIILETIWISNRNVFPSFIGLALMGEAFFQIISKNKFGKVFKFVSIFTITFIFLIINISEISDYRQASLIDRQICEGIIKMVDDKDFNEGRKKVYLFNTKPYYMEQNSFYHDHILNVTSSDWALTGGVRAIAENIKIRYITPVKDGEKFVIDNEIETELLGINENLQIISLYTSNEEHVKYLKDKNGKVFGKIEDQVFNRLQ